MIIVHAFKYRSSLNEYIRCFIQMYKPVIQVRKVSMSEVLLINKERHIFIIPNDSTMNYLGLTWTQLIIHDYMFEPCFKGIIERDLYMKCRGGEQKC